MRKTIFPSYARGDDEPFVERLYYDLRSLGFDIWWDRVSMPSRGSTFLYEIREAIERQERFLLVLGPKAVNSDYVTAEWVQAISFDKPVTPILRLGDYSMIPNELQLFHTKDFRDDSGYSFHLGQLFRQLLEPVPQSGKHSGNSQTA